MIRLLPVGILQYMKFFIPLSVFLSFMITGHAQLDESAKLSFEHIEVLQGDECSLVREIESGIILPGTAHSELWVHPNLVTIPGDPIRIELALRSTDRKGGDKHTLFNYFRTDDDFQTLYPIATPAALAWHTIGLTSDDFEKTPQGQSFFPHGEWHWARNSVQLNSSTIIHPFLTRDDQQRSVRTVTASRKGEALIPLYVSNAVTNSAGRGLLEPQIAQYGEQLYMTMRAEDGFGYISVSMDEGYSWSEPHAWQWEDGEKISMHSTMTKLLSHSDGLLLIYTRIGEDNKNVFRNRAPLYCADVDPDTLSLRKSTERILIPNKGLPAGNFWVWPIDEHKSYVTATEWPRDGRKDNGDTWLAKIYWKKVNTQMSIENQDPLGE